MNSVANLLHTAISRAGVQKQVQASRIVDAANGWMETLLPDPLRREMRAVSCKDGVLWFMSVNPSLVPWVRERGLACKEVVIRQVPDADVKEIRARLVSSLP